LQIAKAELENVSNKNIVSSKILFDSGSQLSYVTPEIAELLKLKPIGKKEICIKSFGEVKQTKILDIVEFFIKTNKGKQKISAFVSEISQPVNGQNTFCAKQSYAHLRNLYLADFNKSSPVKIDVLIGANYYWNFIDIHNIIAGKPGEPVALGSSLGYVLSGPMDTKSFNDFQTSTLTTNVLKAVVDTDPLRESVNKFWDLESLGIKHKDLIETPKNDEILENFEKSIKFCKNENRYEVEFPKKLEHEILGALKLVPHAIYHINLYFL